MMEPLIVVSSIPSAAVRVFYERYDAVVATWKKWEIANPSFVTWSDDGSGDFFCKLFLEKMLAMGFKPRALGNPP